MNLQISNSLLMEANSNLQDNLIKEDKYNFKNLQRLQKNQPNKWWS